MSTALGLAMQISANTAQLAQAVQDVNKRLDEMGTAGKKAASDLGTLKNVQIAALALDGIKAATSAFLSLSSAVTGAVSSVVSFADSVGKELEGLLDVANRTGVGVEALQAYSRAAAQSGVEIETFAKQIQKLTINIGNATLDDKAQKNFERLGLVFEELKQQTPEQQFEAVVDAISKLSEPAERAAAAVKLFGKGGIELGEIFTLGPGALQAMREDAISLGQVVSEDAVKAIDNMNDSFGAVYATVRGLTGQVLGELAGPISQIAQDLLAVIREAGPAQVANTVAKSLLDFIQLAGNAFFELARFLEAFVKKYSSLLGLELRTPEQRARDEEIAKLRRDTAGGGLAGIDPKLRAEILAEQAPLRARLKELEAQVAAEQATSSLTRVQANFNQAIDNASQAVEQRLKTSGAGDDQTNVGEVVDEQRKTNRLLEGQRTVDIVGAN